MYLIYIDDSGDTGLMSRGSPTNAFILCALVVEDHAWLTVLDEIKAFRRFLQHQFGIRQRDELKASYLLHGTGPFRDLDFGHDVRMRIYKLALRFQQKVGYLKTWAILIRKEQLNNEVKPIEIRDRAWRLMIERIERFTYYGKDTCVVFPDEGHPEFVKGMFRKMRRINQVPSAFDEGELLSRPATFIVEDPNFRRSQESYFIQLTDLNAYAAYRHIYPESYFGEEYWDQLGDTRVKEVTKIRGGPTGIKVWP
jgi:hypothetical protein